MTWTASEPTGSSRIRLLPDLLQQRWTNIQEGTVPADRWQLVVQDPDPDEEPGSGLIYTKENSGGFAELFYRDDNSNIIRMTNSGGVGYWGQTLYGEQIKLNQTSGFAYTRDGMISCAGKITSDGIIFANAFNVASVSGPTGSSEYTINFTTPLNTLYAVVCTVNTTSGSTLRIAITTEISANRFKVKTFKDEGLAPVTSDAGFSFIVVGGRPGE